MFRGRDNHGIRNLLGALPQADAGPLNGGGVQNTLSRGYLSRVYGVTFLIMKLETNLPFASLLYRVVVIIDLARPGTATQAAHWEPRSRAFLFGRMNAIADCLGGRLPSC